MTPVVLIIAGVDPSGGAGLVADVATASRRGLHAAAVPTALTLQDSARCHAVSPVDAAWLRAELDLLVADLGPALRAIKIGMVGAPTIAAVLADALAPPVRSGVPLVLDPVLRASVGVDLLAGSAAALDPLIALTALVTPNRDEAARLTGLSVDDRADQQRAAAVLRGRGARAVLVKGGHLGAGEARVADLLDDGGEPLWLDGERLPGPTPHGTGCALSTEIACGLALGRPLREAVSEGRARLVARIAAARPLGRGRPLLPPF